MLLLKTRLTSETMSVTTGITTAGTSSIHVIAPPRRALGTYDAPAHKCGGALWSSCSVRSSGHGLDSCQIRARLGREPRGMAGQRGIAAQARKTAPPQIRRPTPPRSPKLPKLSALHACWALDPGASNHRLAIWGHPHYECPWSAVDSSCDDRIVAVML